MKNVAFFVQLRTKVVLLSR